MKKFLKASILLLLLIPMIWTTAYAQTGVKITYAGQVVDSITFNGVTVNAIYAPRNSVKNYPGDTTYSCAAFVKKFYKQVYGVEVYNLLKAGGGPLVSGGKGSFSKVSSPQVGDVVHYLTSTTTHWCIVKSVSSDKKQVTVIEQNGWNDANYISARVGKTYNVGDSTVTFYRYSNASTPNGSSVSQTPNVVITTSAATNITATSAQLNGSLSANGTVKITEHGAYLGTSTSNMTLVAKDTVNYSKTSLTMFYSTAKYGTTLKPDTTYYYYQYAVVDGKTINGSVVSFKTSSSSTPSTAGNASARTIAPDNSNSYYYSNKNPFYSAGHVGQCTWYAYGRAYELLGSKPSLSTGNANEWYNYNKQYGYYPYGSTPQIGAIACINSSAGHVAVVEDIANGKPVFSEFNVSSDKSFHYGRNITSPIVGYIYILGNSGASKGDTSTLPDTTPTPPATTPSNPTPATPAPTPSDPPPAAPAPTTPEPISPPVAPVIKINTTSIQEGETATLTWASVPNSTSYEVSIWSVMANQGSSYTTTNTQYVLSGLTEGIYQFEVYAKGSAGTSEASNFIRLTVTGNGPVISVKTTAATNITATSAQLNGTLTASGNVHIRQHGVAILSEAGTAVGGDRDTVDYNKSSLTVMK